MTLCFLQFAGSLLCFFETANIGVLVAALHSRVTHARAKAVKNLLSTKWSRARMSNNFTGPDTKAPAVVQLGPFFNVFTAACSTRYTRWGMMAKLKKLALRRICSGAHTNTVAICMHTTEYVYQFRVTFLRLNFSYVLHRYFLINKSRFYWSVGCIRK